MGWKDVLLLCKNTLKVALIKSISGFRGTIGGKTGDNLSPKDIVELTYGYAVWLKSKSTNKKTTIVIGRDGRISGDMVSRLVTGTLLACGVDVKDAGLSTTPSIEMLVPHLKADGGIILTASHNPMEWNALKLLNNKGEFISAADGAELLNTIENSEFSFAEIQDLGKSEVLVGGGIEYHIEEILKDKLVDVEAIKKANFKVVFDGINSTGSIAIPKLLKALGVTDFEGINTEIGVVFAHNPEPLKKHLTDICDKVKEKKADIGIVVDPDVDRLAFIDETGEMYGEEYTLITVADYMFKTQRGAVVSNLSSSRALADLAAKNGNDYYAAAVGEVNVVEKMKEVSAILGGEGDGGIIYPPLHYGRDALVGIALVLTYMAKEKKSLSQLKESYSQYFMIKDQIQLDATIDVDAILQRISSAFANEKVDKTDGVKVDFANGWVHLRKSNTEPIIRVYAEAPTEKEAITLVDSIKEEVFSKK